MKDNISPEEKLLRLIRGQKKQDTAIDKKPVSINVAPEIKLRDKIPVRTLFKKHLSFLYIHKAYEIILVIFVISCLYLLTSFIYSWVGLRKVKLPTVVAEKINQEKIEPKIEVRTYEFYLEGIKNHQIFSRGPIAETGKPISGMNADLLKDITLVGIISGENPVGIIEDKKTQKTYYVTKGQFINEFQVEDIQEGKIILNYNEQRYELYL